MIDLTRLAAPLVAALMAPAAHGQIYKCPDTQGRTVMQQMPCAGGQTIKAPNATQKTEAPSEQRRKAAQLCESALRSVPAWKDPSTLQIDDVVRIGATTRALHNTSLPVVQYGTFVNGRNTYGAYAGKKPAFCYFDLSETRLLDVQTF